VIVRNGLQRAHLLNHCCCAPQVIELLEAAEAKAYYGLAINWKPLEALSTALLERGVLQGKEVGACCCTGWGAWCPVDVV
jgi:hypothetical protein